MWAAMHTPAMRDPRGYIIPSSQADFPTAVKFINALREVGIKVQRATREFEVQGKKYPAGSFVVMGAQSFRPHVMDMFEPQDHPDNIPFAGAAPTPPYDHAGWTLAFQMGVEFDRILDAFTGPFEPVTDWNVKPPVGKVTSLNGAAGYTLSHKMVDSFVALNQLLKANEEVYWLPDGAWYVPARPSTRAVLERIAVDLGVGATATSEKPAAAARKLRTPRVGLWDQYGGSMDSGWARWILEQYRPMLGRVSAERTIPELRRFVENGGTVITIGASATNIARHFQLPILDHLVENGTPLPAAKFYAPGSIMTAKVDVTHPIAHGMNERTDIFFDTSPVFRLDAAAAGRGIRSVAWFDTAAPLKSGWAWGQQHLQNGVAVIDAPLGKGRVLLFGPEIMKRAQPHGTFKFLFNGIYLAVAGS